MTPSPGQRPTWGGVPLTRRRMVLGLAAVGGFLAVDLGAVAWAGGWLDTAHRLTPESFIKAFVLGQREAVGFPQEPREGRRAVRRLLRLATATVESCPAPKCSARVARRWLAASRSPVARSPPRRRRARDCTRTRSGVRVSRRTRNRAIPAMLNLPVFPDSSPQGFYDRLIASKPSPDTGKPDPKVMAAFLAAHPETAKAMKIIGQNSPSSGFCGQHVPQPPHVLLRRRTRAYGRRSGGRWCP